MTVAEHGEEGVNVSALLASLEAGSYTIEASTFRAERTGAFDFEIEFPRQAAAARLRRDASIMGWRYARGGLAVH